MSVTNRVLAGVVVIALAAVAFARPVAPNDGPATEPSPGAPPAAPAADTAVAALIEANGGKPPATGGELWSAR